jgi:dTDP-4-dehydrorhamnose reductase
VKILVTGSQGQLGSELLKLLDDPFPVDIGDCDLTLQASVDELFKNKFDAVIHCAAYTNVDKAEIEPEKAYAVNALATENIARHSKDIPLVFVSTDYVFDGSGTEAREADAPPNPLSVYGKTKLAGENIVRKELNKFFIARTSWLYGNGGNFVRSMINLSKAKKEINVVCDQIGSPTYARDLALVLAKMIKTNRYGIYHTTNEGYCSWAEFAQEIFKLLGIATKVNFIPSSEYPTAAKRPLNSRLSKRSLSENGFDLLPHWKDALKRYLI